jgi:N-acetylmuramoyl-L-alanine amidase
MHHSFIRTVPRGRLWQCVIVIVLGLAIFFMAKPAEAQSPAVRYERALAREKAARTMTGTSAGTLRTIAKSYEAIVHAYPRSGYADNALWQGAGLLQLAYERSGSLGDLQNARRLLNWLKREYPTAPLAKQVNARLNALKAGPKSTARPAAVVASAKRSAAPAPSAAPPAAESAAPAAAEESPEVIGDESTAAGVSAAAPDLAALDVDLRSAEPATDAVAAVWTPMPAPRAVELAPIPMPALTAPPPETAVPVRTITHSVLPRGDRITIELGREAVYTTSRVGNPDRVEIDLNEAALAGGLTERTSTISGALIKSLSARRVGRQGARVVIELNGKPRFSTFPLYNPFRLVIDVESDAAPASATAAPPAPVPPAPAAARATSKSTAAAPKPPLVSGSTIDDPLPAPATPASTGRGDFSLARQLGLGVSRIVIDAGHGGHDPGARANGVNEADVVLDVALRVEALLKAQPGFDVVLTRRTDVFIPLEERTAIANRESADMFLSIHVNASPRTATRGIETYLLDFASNPDAEALAARENATSGQSMRVLPDLVKAIALNNKVDESRELARMVQSSLVGRITPLSRGLKDLGVKRAPFVVLIGAQMPSVLAEISFVTNKTDAALMKQASHRQRIAQALADAVLKYRTSLKTEAPSTAQTAARQSALQ